MAKENKEKESPEEEKIEEPKKKPVLKMFLIISIVLVVVAVGAIAGYLLLTKTDNPKQAAPEKPAEISFWPMEAFIVNIADAESERYLKIVMQLETSDSGVIAELEKLKPRIRDSILDLLTPKTYKDLMDLAGKQRLREDVAGRVNNILEHGKVTRVYFTEFVVQ